VTKKHQPVSQYKLHKRRTTKPSEPAGFRFIDNNVSDVCETTLGDGYDPGYSVSKPFQGLKIAVHDDQTVIGGYPGQARVHLEIRADPDAAETRSFAQDGACEQASDKQARQQTSQLNGVS